MPDGDCLIDKDENFVGLSQGLGMSCTTLLVIHLDITHLCCQPLKGTGSCDKGQCRTEARGSELGGKCGTAETIPKELVRST